MRCFWKFCLVLSLLAGLTGCGGSGGSTAASGNVVAVAQSQGFNVLAAAVTKAGLVSTLSSAPSVTVFAPTDAAFDTLAQQLGLANGTALVNALPAATLASILEYHVLGSEQSASVLEGESQVATLYAYNGNPASLQLGTSGGSLSITDADLATANVTIANVLATNGLVHAINKVLIPPGVLNVVEMAQANPQQFSSLVGALGSANLVSALSGNGPFTVFAPDNQAFAAIQSTVASLTTAQLTLVLEYHVLPEAVQAAAIPFGTPIATLAGQNITINAGTPPTITDTTATPADIIVTDVEASNGVIHVINKVLIPAL